jgi:protein-L-isoaspartate O-methyltransferase
MLRTRHGSAPTKRSRGTAANAVNTAGERMWAVKRNSSARIGAPRGFDWICQLIDVAVGEQALHLGCGTGYYTVVVSATRPLSSWLDALKLSASCFQ